MSSSAARCASCRPSPRGASVKRCASAGVLSRRGKSIRELCVVHQRHRTAVLEDVGDLRRLQSRAHRHRDRAQAQDPEQRENEFRPIAHEHRDPVPRVHAERGQPGGDALRLRVELGVGPAALPGHERFAFRVRPCGSPRTAARGRARARPKQRITRSSKWDSCRTGRRHPESGVIAGRSKLAGRRPRAAHEKGAATAAPRC